MAKRILGFELFDDRYRSLHGLLVLVSVVQFQVTWIFAGEQGIKIGTICRTNSRIGPI